jgi:hypothetical protein
VTAAERRINAIITDYERRMAANSEGIEQLFLMEVVRAIDEIAYAFTLAPNREELRSSDHARHTMLRGVALALRPLLRAVRGLPGPIPLAPSNPRSAQCADEHLFNCGRLAHVSRIAALERYGLCTSSFVANDHVVFEVVNADGDLHDVQSLQYLRSLIQEASSGAEAALLALTPQIHQQMEAYVRVDRDDFIAYDNDASLVRYYYELARIRSASCFEGEALSASSPLGGRTFATWCDRGAAAAGRVLQHAAFATRLKTKVPGMELRNLLTIYARKEDLIGVLEEFGDTRDQAESFMAATTLDAASVERDFSDHEIPVPLYIDFSQDFALLPCFGALLNPIAGLVRSLRSGYRSEWDQAVGGREPAFRADLTSLLPRQRFWVQDRGSTLRRPDGTKLTDIDAVVLDQETGRLALFQLKWHDIVGRSLRERHSRRLNLLAADNWVDRVSLWIDGRSSAAVATALGIRSASSNERPYLFVVSRYAAQFAGHGSYDPRAAWLTWPDVVRAAHASAGSDIIDSIAREFAGGWKPQPQNDLPATQIFRLPGLTAEVRMH